MPMSGQESVGLDPDLQLDSRLLFCHSGLTKAHSVGTNMQVRAEC